MIPALQGDRTSMLQTVLPEDPENGHLVEMPAGQTVGGANVISVHKGGKFCGTVTQVAPIHNASGKYEALRLSSCVRIRVGDTLRILGQQYNFTSLKFVEGFGWQGHKTNDTPLLLMDKPMQVLETSILGENTPGYYLYEKVCLSVIREKGETHDKSTSNTPPTTSRDTTTPSGGTTPPRGSSGSAPGTDPTTGSCSNPQRSTSDVDAGAGSPE